MRLLPKLAIVAFVAGTLGFAGGAITSAIRGWGSPLVPVVVENQTTSLVSFINLHHSSCGGTNSLSAQNLRPGQSHTFRFLVCGEGAYKLDAMLDNKMVLSSEAYVESGYRVVETIEAFRIRSETKSFPL